MEDDHGVIHTKHSEIADVAVGYFKSLLGTVHTVDEFPSDISINFLDEEQVAAMDAQFTVEDIINTFKSMRINHSPGLDRFTPDLFVKA